MNVLYFVLMVCWNQHMTSIEMYSPGYKVTCVVHVSRVWISRYIYCMQICDKLSRDLAMLSYLNLNVDDCWLTSSMPQQMFKLQILLNHAVIPENVISEDLF